MTVISEFSTFFLFSLIAIFTEGIRQILIEVPAIIILAVPEYFPLDLLLTVIYYFSIRYLIKMHPLFGNQGIRIGSALLLFLFLSLIALTVYLLYRRFEDEEIRYIHIMDFLVPFSYCPVVILVNEFIYPKWSFRKMD